MAEEQNGINSKILEFIHSEIQDNSAVVDMDTPISSVNIDSIDEEVNTTIDLPQDSKFETVGDFVRALTKFIPAAGQA